MKIGARSTSNGKIYRHDGKQTMARSPNTRNKLSKNKVTLDVGIIMDLFILTRSTILVVLKLTCFVLLYTDAK